MREGIQGKKFLIFLMVGVLACGIGIYFRLYPLLNYTSHEASEKATLLVLTNLRKRVETAIQKKSPRLPDVPKKRLIKKRFDALLHSERDNARKAIHRVARQITRANPAGQTFPYLLASDSYYYFGLTENIQQTGTISNTVKGSKYLNTLMLAPLGHWEPFNWHPFVGYYIHKIISVFRPGIPLVYSVSFTPLVVTALSLIPFLFICFLLRCSPLASFAGSVSFLLAPIFLKRSTFGWYDNDPYNTLFPLAILAFLFYGLSKRHSTKSTIVWGCLCALVISLYALFWQGWVFLEGVIIVSGILILLFNHFCIKRKPESRNLLLYFCIIIAGTFVGIGIIFGFGEFLVLFREGWVALKNFLTPRLTSWPDMYISVGELRKAPPSLIINLTGGPVFFTVALWGLLTRLSKFSRPRENTETLFPVIIMAVFLTFAVTVTLGAQRFALLCLVPLSLLFTLGVQNIFDLINTFIRKRFKGTRYHPFVIRLICVSIVVGLSILSMATAYKKLPSLLDPIFNATWETALTKINKSTPPESIVNTWWPPGHFIKSIAKRKVTFDGATINSPQAYWMANIFLNSDERRALGLLRMLNNSANRSADYLIESGFELSRAVGILKEITPLTPRQAREKLYPIMRPGQIDALLKLTHKPPPPSYLLIYKELIEKNLELSFVGNWNFKKIEDINSHPEQHRQVPTPGSKEYIKFLWDIAGGPLKYHTPFAAIAQSKEVIVFEHNIKINLKNMRCTIDSKKFGKGIPYSLFYLKDNQLVEKKFANATLPFSVLFAKRPNGNICVLMDTYLARSLIMRLYFFEGKGLAYIQPFLKESDLTGRTRIYVYQIDWEGFREGI